MSDTFYKLVVLFGRFPFWVSSRPTVLHAGRARRDGAYILASNHLSPFDVPALMRSTPRMLDFVSVVEIFQRPFVGWFFSHMNAFPLDRSRQDTKTVRIVLDRLQRGRVVAMFPEGRVRKEPESVINGAPFRPGVARIAQLANVPIVPVIVLGSGQYKRRSNWLPLRRVRYGIAFGHPIEAQDIAAAEMQLAQAYQDLHAELRAAMG